MFVKLELYSSKVTPASGFEYVKLGTRYINSNHIVEVSDSSNGYSAITLHGGNAQSNTVYFVSVKADALVTHLSSKR